MLVLVGLLGLNFYVKSIRQIWKLKFGFSMDLQGVAKKTEGATAWIRQLV